MWWWKILLCLREIWKIANSKLYSFLLNFDLFFRGQLCSSWKEETGIWEKSSYNAHINVILCTFYKLVAKNVAFTNICQKNAAFTHFCRKTNSELGPKWDQSINLVPKKSRFCLQVPNFSGFLIFSQLSQVFSGFLSFSQLFSGFLRFYTNHRVYTGGPIWPRIQDLKKSPFCLQVLNFSAFLGFFSGFLSFSRLFSVSVYGFLRLCINGRDYTLLEAFFPFC